MAVFKCKMCGGTIEFEPGASVGVCDSCGTKQTLPRLDDDRRANLYDRANHFRRANEFDKAAGLYEQILNEDTTDAEAYWSLVLCRYGIEYVEDPATHRRVPTVNRAQFTSVFDDDNYRSALRCADAFQRGLYEEEAKAINDIQKGILAVSRQEEPFDVFICYKETDNNGRRTPDSVLANDLYHQLTQEGFKVFFSRITLEDKLGTAYEPYIFAALNSSKVMVALGTKPEYFNAVWVKNEWSRYLSLVNESGGKKVLIPAYRDMDPYDLPEEFSHLQAQDMSKLGFMQDLIRGIKKIVSTDEPKSVVSEPVVVNSGGANAAPLLRRAFMFLEDGEWGKADDFCEQVLNLEPENAQAYLGKLMSDLRVHRQEDLINCERPFDQNNYFKKAVRFGDDKLVAELEGYIDNINKRNENARLTGIYNEAVETMNSARTEDAYKAAADLFKTISDFKDSSQLTNRCFELAENCRKDAKNVAKGFRKRLIAIISPIFFVFIIFIIVLLTVIIPGFRYSAAISNIEKGNIIDGYETLLSLNGYKDSEEKANDVFENYEIEKLKVSKVGDIIVFGKYEQDNDISNGKEAIEWIVLAKDSGKALIISKQALDCQQYNNEYLDITWEDSSLRRWLNGTFADNAFSNKEYTLILNTKVTADINPAYDTDPGNSTMDKIFLLSITEANLYFGSDEERICSPTDFAKAQGAFGKDASEWWLRSPGIFSDRASRVIGSSMLRGGSVVDCGFVDTSGAYVNATYLAVRPALWINLGS
ncbi:MAG: toll/interleukin-1 receptor domain-containing protein [Clostridia bacterium]|nr:toll/interleukin-1 receptor domain-containing protein [Clostridia bacterium]